MKTSIITPCLNCAPTIENTIKSIVSQNYNNLEYIVIDGKSTDGTNDIFKKYKNHIQTYISEPDEGVYHAMNKGIAIATGSIIGILNADDFYASDSVISNIVEFMEYQQLDAVYGDLVYVAPDDTSRIVRFWEAGDYKPGAFRKGWVPPHPTFFCRREIYEKYGGFRIDMKIAADFELMMRFIENHKIKLGYLPKTLVKMRTGGKAYDFKGRIRGNIEIFKSFKVNDLKPSPFYFISKPVIKFSQILKRPKKQT